MNNLYCIECKTDKVVIGCPYCVKEKIKAMEKELEFYKNELELIKEN